LDEAYYIFSTAVTVLIDIMLALMLIRAIAGWFFLDSGSKFMDIIYMITEPIIFPMRKLFEKFEWFEDSPIDMAYLFTSLALIIVSVVLSLFRG